MTVRELIRELLDHDMNAEVIMSKDAEGSRYSPASDIKRGRYTAETTWSGGFLYSSEYNPHTGYGSNAVVIRPVNQPQLHNNPPGRQRPGGLCFDHVFGAGGVPTSPVPLHVEHTDHA